MVKIVESDRNFDIEGRKPVPVPKSECRCRNRISLFRNPNPNFGKSKFRRNYDKIPSEFRFRHKFKNYRYVLWALKYQRNMDTS
jgi:hypothetical protein